VVPAGENRVDFVYYAPLLPAGIAMAVIGWTIVTVGAVVRARALRVSFRERSLGAAPTSSV
jgi:hypothetical protein